MLMVMDEGEQQEVILGAFDGITSSLGGVVGLTLHGNIRLLVVITLNYAVAAAMGMGLGEFLSLRNKPDQRWHRTRLMAEASFFGSILPAIPFIFFGLWPGVLLAGAGAIITGAIIGHVRGGGWRSYVGTYAAMAVVTGVTTAVTIVGGVG